MPLSPVEQAFAEAALIEGLVTGPRLALALKLREANAKKPLPNHALDLRLMDPDTAKRLWRAADLAVKASAPASFSFSAGAMMGPYVLVEPRGARALAGEHWRAKRPEGLGFLRLVPPGTGLDAERAQRLIDRANAGIEAPDASILRVDDAGEEFNWLYTGTIGFDGESLATRVARGPLAESEALVLLATIAQALRVAHGFGVVHAGLNPLAVVYGADGTPRVTDFGIGSAFFDGALAGMHPGQRLGLLLYAAPELLRGGADTGLDARADLYAAGALVYEAIAAVRPGDVRAPEGDPWLVKPPVSDGLATILRRLLALEVEERYSSADALAEDVERVQGGSLPGPLPPAGPPLLVASRPSTAAPLEVLTAELIQNAEASVHQPLVATAGGSLPPSVGRSPATTDEPDAPARSDEIELAPPTVDPDADLEPALARDLASGDSDPANPALEPAPPTVDPDAPPPPRPKPSKKTVVRRAPAVKAPAQPKGLLPLFLSFVVVAGAFGGASAATAPDGRAAARRELGAAYLAFDRDHDFAKAQAALAEARRRAGSDPAVATEVAEVEGALRRHRIQSYLAARRSSDGFESGAAAVEGTPLDALHRFDVAKRDLPADAKVWDRIGLDLLEQGFPEDAAAALEQAATRDRVFEKDRDLAARARELGAWLPAGTYAGARLTLARPVYVGRTPVTRAQYARWLVEAKKGNLHASCAKKEPEGEAHDPEGWDPVVALAAEDARPATGLDLWDALAYANARGVKLVTAGQRLALAQGPVARPAPWGSGPFDPARANMGNAWGELLPAGILAAGASPLGGLDLLGNVEEWLAPASEDATDGQVAGADFGAATERLALDEVRPAKAAERSGRRGFRCAVDLGAGGAP